MHIIGLLEKTQHSKARVHNTSHTPGGAGFWTPKPGGIRLLCLPKLLKVLQVQRAKSNLYPLRFYMVNESVILSAFPSGPMLVMYMTSWDMTERQRKWESAVTLPFISIGWQQSPPPMRVLRRWTHCAPCAPCRVTRFQQCLPHAAWL